VLLSLLINLLLYNKIERIDFSIRSDAVLLIQL
jgi:hypothetical protein